MLSVVLSATVMVGVMGASTTAPPEPAKCCFDKEFSATLGELGYWADADMQGAGIIDVSVWLLFMAIKKRPVSYTHLTLPTRRTV